ncbi:MAG: hypothetical protein QOK29_623, partial [Rhodospirillaceae bacterium]|nr:hypothetical protein [Rhodospirillaceae bacterium]
MNALANKSTKVAMSAALLAAVF